MVASMITNTRYVLVTFEQMLKAAFFGAGGGLPSFILNQLVSTKRPKHEKYDEKIQSIRKALGSSGQVLSYNTWYVSRSESKRSSSIVISTFFVGLKKMLT